MLRRQKQQSINFIEVKDLAMTNGKRKVKELSAGRIWSHDRQFERHVFYRCAMQQLLPTLIPYSLPTERPLPIDI